MAEIFQFPENEFSARLRFAEDRLRLFGARSELKIVAQTPYSLVFESSENPAGRAPSDLPEPLFFKFNPPGSADEAGLIALLAEVEPGLAPRLLGSWPDQRALATLGAGSPVFEVAETEPAIDAMEKALRSMGRAQWKLSAELARFAAEAPEALSQARERAARPAPPFARAGSEAPGQGARLLRCVQEVSPLRDLPRRIRQLADFGGILEADGLLPFARDRLLWALERAEALCLELSLLDVNASLEHGDFHDGNAMVDAQGQTRVIDWAEARVAHPFFTFESVASRLSRHRGLRRNSPEVLRLQAAHDEAWAADVDAQQLAEARRLAHLLYPLYYVACGVRLLRLPGTREALPRGWFCAPLEEFCASVLPADAV